ncbi:MAG: MFS transporter [Bifidobacteriaceae bacterium]|jgi:MFS family permease|nr:MFS transporter [Bifidobacteriaceae bacterium]
MPFPGQPAQSAVNPVAGRDFGLLVAGQVVSVIGSATLRFALDLHVLDITGGADVFALVVALSALPGIAFTPIGGAVADRFPKRNLMIGLDAASAALVLALIVAMGLGQAPVSVIGLALAVLCLISSMYQPTVQASVPALVPQDRLADANGLVSGIGALSSFVAPVVGGALYGLVGIGTLLIASCAAFAASSLLEVFIRIPFAKRSSDRPLAATLLGDVRQGLRFAGRDNPLVLRVIGLACALNMLLVPVFLIGVPYILRLTLHSTDTMYGLGLACTEAATIIGAIFAGKLTRGLRMANLSRALWLIAALMVPMAAAMLPAVRSLGYWPPFAGFFAFEMAAVAACTAVSIFAITQIQKTTPKEMTGKVMALLLAGSQIAAPIGQIAYGFAFEGFSSETWVPFAFAAGMAALIAAAERLRALRHPK